MAISKSRMVLTVFCMISICQLTFAQIDTLTLSSFSKSPNVEIIAQIVTTAYQRAGIKVGVVFQNPKNSLESVLRGEYDGELARIDGVEKIHPTLIKVEIPIFAADINVYSKNYDIDIHGWQSISKYKVGFLEGSIFTKEGSNYIPDRVYRKTNRELMDLLIKDEIDLLISGEETEFLRFRENDIYGNIKKMKGALRTILFYHYLRDYNAQYKEVVEEELMNMLMGGEIYDILQKHRIRMKEDYNIDIDSVRYMVD